MILPAGVRKRGGELLAARLLLCPMPGVCLAQVTRSSESSSSVIDVPTNGAGMSWARRSENDIRGAGVRGGSSKEAFDQRAIGVGGKSEDALVGVGFPASCPAGTARAEMGVNSGFKASFNVFRGVSGKLKANALSLAFVSAAAA